jgi:hypothetical protein
MLDVHIRSPRDLGAAIVFLVIGLAGLFLARDLAFGTSARMGPGYFPTILSAIIAALGAVMALRSLSVGGPRIEVIQLRPIGFIVAAVLLFGPLLELLGLVLTAVIITIVAAYAKRGVNVRETLWLGAGLALFSVVVFVLALSQPLPIWWGAE